MTGERLIQCHVSNVVYARICTQVPEDAELADCYYAEDDDFEDVVGVLF